MKKYFIFTVAMIFVANIAFASQVDKVREGRYFVPKTLLTPTIDGKISEGEWQNAVGISNFVDYSSKTLDPQVMTTYITYDDKYFYIAAKMAVDPPGSKLRANQKRRDFIPNGLQDERIEIFLDPNYGEHTVKKGHFFFLVNLCTY